MDIDIKKGDILLGGRFKNKRIVVKELSTDELNQPTVNDRSLLNYRIEKDLPYDKKSFKTKEQITMNKEAILHEITKMAFFDELEIATKP